MTDASRVVAALVPVLLGGCIDPDYGIGGFRCPDGLCPEGYVCVAEAAAKVCRLPGARSDAALFDQPRPRTEARIDQAATDRASDRRSTDLLARRDSGPDACLPQPYFKDGDGDGYGNPLVKVVVCAQRAGYVAKGLDCDDADPDAHPGQTAFFEQPTQGTKSFDFNCDKVDEKEHPSLVNCTPSGAGCSGDGWSGTIAACGQSGSYAKCFKQSGMSGCSQSVNPLVQRCR